MQNYLWVNSIKSTDYYIHFQTKAFEKLNNYLPDDEISKIFVLVDTNTQKHCLQHFRAQLNSSIPIEIIKIRAGEIYKNINTCLEVWSVLTELKADRKSLLINLGGGMVTDLGGFVASTFKRGIKFINIPTTLLSMVDASVGSKTGVDLGNLKNLIGLFSNPEMVVVDTHFLNTVPKRELRSGLAEIIKYGLSYDINLWSKISNDNNLLNNNLTEIIYRSIEIKNEIVLKDLKETSLRKVLNFGHTVGHAIESHFLEIQILETLTHGEAIAIGMIVEMYLSYRLLDFPKEKLKEVSAKIIEVFGQVVISKNDYSTIIDLMKHDKKNIGNNINFVLLNDLADYKIDCQVPNELLIEGLNYYN